MSKRGERSSRSCDCSNVSPYVSCYHLFLYTKQWRMKWGCGLPNLWGYGVWYVVMEYEWMICTASCRINHTLVRHYAGVRTLAVPHNWESPFHRHPRIKAWPWQKALMHTVLVNTVLWALGRSILGLGISLHRHCEISENLTLNPAISAKIHHFFFSQTWGSRLKYLP